MHLPPLSLSLSLSLSEFHCLLISLFLSSISSLALFSFFFFCYCFSSPSLSLSLSLCMPIFLSLRLFFFHKEKLQSFDRPELTPTYQSKSRSQVPGRHFCLSLSIDQLFFTASFRYLCAHARMRKSKQMNLTLVGWLVGWLVGSLQHIISCLVILLWSQLSNDCLLLYTIKKCTFTMILKK